jgi:hypothetical protein
LIQKVCSFIFDDVIILLEFSTVFLLAEENVDFISTPKIVYFSILDGTSQSAESPHGDLAI